MDHWIGGWFVCAWDAAMIKNIPLSWTRADDVLFWPYSSNGEYNCKSRYRFLKEESELSELSKTSQVPPLRDKQVWKRIWFMCVQQKVKNFIWRACRNAMPTKLALVRRTIISKPMCERCNSAVEDAIHALWSCSKLDSMWSDQSLWSFRGRVGFVDFKELISWMIAEGKPLELFAVTAWMIWNQRYHVRLHRPAAAFHQVATLASTSLTKFQTRLSAPRTVR